MSFMNNKLSVSIITVCFNSEATIRGTLESVRSQYYEKLEHVVVDGASSDGTVNIVNQYRDSVSTVVSEPDRGLYDAMNKGIHHATGDIIGILNSDDFLKIKRWFLRLCVYSRIIQRLISYSVMWSSLSLTISSE